MPVSRATNSDTFKVTTPSDREITLTRLFDAPRDLVFEAMSKPEHVRRWWGALDDKHSMTVCEIDFRPGGKWRFVGRTPKGDIPAFYGEFRDIVPPEDGEPYSLTCRVYRRRDGRISPVPDPEDVRDAVRRAA